MPLDPNIPLSFQPPQLPDYNALVQQRGQNMANMMTMQNAIEDRQAGQQAAQDAAMQKALSPALAAAFTNPTDEGLVAAFDLVPDQYKDAAQEQLAQLQAIPDVNIRKSVLRTGLAQYDFGKIILQQIEPSANMALQAKTAEQRAAIDQQRLALDQAKLDAEAAGGKVAQWITGDDGTVTGLDAYGNVVATVPGVGKKAAATGPDGVKLKPGERLNAEGNIEAVPGSETYNKQKGAHADDYKAARATIDSLATTTQAIDDIKNTSGWQKATNTGTLMARMPNVPGVSSATGAYDFQTKYNNLKGAVASFGRSVASLQGKLGNMAVQEWKMVSDSIAALDLTNMDSATLDDQLDKIATQLQAAETTIRDAYDQQYQGSQFYTPLPATGAKAKAKKAAPPATTSEDTNGDGVIDFNDLN